MKNAIFLTLIIFLGCSRSADTEEKTEYPYPAMEQVALKQGNRIASQAQQALGSQLMKMIKSQGPEAAVSFCNLAAYPILDSLNTGMEVKVRRASVKTRNPENKANDIEKRILKAYEGRLAERQDLKPVIEQLSKEELLYAAPIQTKNRMCLNCHGTITSR